MGAESAAEYVSGRVRANVKAHLVRFDQMPSIVGFRRRVSNALEGHAAVFEKMIEEWQGDGWPV